MNEHDPSARDDEIVSAYLDGEATTAERAIVEASPALLARVAEFADVQHQVGAEVVVDAPQREVHIAAALAEAGHPQVITPLAKPRDRRQLTRLALSAAAAVVVIGLAVPVLRNLDSSSDDTAASVSDRVADALPALAGDEAQGDTGGDTGDAADLEAGTGSEGSAESNDGDAPSSTMVTGEADEPEIEALFAAVTELGAFSDDDAFVVGVRAALDQDSIVEERSPGNVTCALEAISLVGDLELVGSADLDGRPVTFAVGRGTTGDRQLVVLDVADCAPVLDTIL